MCQYVIQDREAGNIIDQFMTLEEAQNTLAQYESEDKREGVYTENFYEIKKIEDWL